MVILNKYRFSILLSSLLVLLVLIPVVKDHSFTSYILSTTITYILLSSLLALSGRKQLFRIGLLLGVPYFLLNWLLSYNLDILFIERTVLILGILYYSFMTVALLQKILRELEVSLETIFAALSAYLLLGITWASIYALIDSFHPGSFHNIPTDLADPRFRFIYYSFVTLTTLGYGDITPDTAIAQSWTILEAVIGQIYLIVVISGLVGLFISKDNKRNNTEK